MSGVWETGEAGNRPAPEGLQARLAAAVDGLMAKPEGRAFLRWLLAACRCFEAQAPAPGAGPLAEHLVFAEGARQVGMRVLRLLEAANQAHFANLLLTREDDDERDGSGNGDGGAHGGHPPAGLHA